MAWRPMAARASLSLWRPHAVAPHEHHSETVSPPLECDDSASLATVCTGGGPRASQTLLIGVGQDFAKSASPCVLNRP